MNPTSLNAPLPTLRELLLAHSVQWYKKTLTINSIEKYILSGSWTNYIASLPASTIKSCVGLICLNHLITLSPWSQCSRKVFHNVRHIDHCFFNQHQTFLWTGGQKLSTWILKVKTSPLPSEGMKIWVSHCDLNTTISPSKPITNLNCVFISYPPQKWYDLCR